MPDVPSESYIERLLYDAPRQPALRIHPDDPEFVQFAYDDGTIGNVPRLALDLIPRLQEIHRDLREQAERLGIPLTLHAYAADR